MRLLERELLPERKLRALRRLIEHTVPGQLSIAILGIEAPVDRAAMVDYVADWAEEIGKTHRHVDLSTFRGVNLWVELLELLGDERPQVLSFTGLEGRVGDPDSEGPDLVTQFNVQRDLFVRDTPACWVMIFHPYAKRQLTWKALDFSAFAVLQIDGERRVETPSAIPMDGGPALASPTPNTTVRQETYQEISQKIDQGRLDEARDALMALGFTPPEGDWEASIRDFLKARLLAEDGDREAAREAFEALLPRLSALGATENLATVHGELAKLLIHEGRTVEAMAHIIRRIELLDTLEDPPTRLLALSQRARLQVMLGDLAEAEASFREQLAMLEQRGDEASTLAVLGDLTEVAFKRGDLTQAARWQQRLATLADTLDVPIAQALARRWLGDLKLEQGDVEGSEQAFEEAQLMFERAGDADAAVHVQLQRAIFRRARGDIDGAAALLEQAMAWLAEQGSAHARAVVQRELGLLQAARGEPGRGLTTLREALAAVKAFGDTRTTARILGDIASIVAQAGNWEAARGHRAQQLRLFQAQGEMRGIAMALTELAHCELQLGLRAEARAHAEEAAHIAEQLKTPEALLSAYSLMANLQLSDGHLEAALASMARAKEAAEASGHTQAISDIDATSQRVHARLNGTETPNPSD